MADVIVRNETCGRVIVEVRAVPVEAPGDELDDLRRRLRHAHEAREQAERLARELSEQLEAAQRKPAAGLRDLLVDMVKRHAKRTDRLRAYRVDFPALQYSAGGETFEQAVESCVELMLRDLAP